MISTSVNFVGKPNQTVVHSGIPSCARGHALPQVAERLSVTITEPDTPVPERPSPWYSIHHVAGDPALYRVCLRCQSDVDQRVAKVRLFQLAGKSGRGVRCHEKMGIGCRGGPPAT